MTALWLGFVVTWAFGVAVLGALRGHTTVWTRPGECAWTLGCGWFVGVFLMTLWMRALSAAGIPFGVVSIGAPIVASALLAAGLAWRTSGHVPAQALRSAGRDLVGADLEPWSRALWLTIIGWLVLRFGLLVAEIVRRPLYPWDAWTQWATKARVWYALKAMAPFVTASEWLQATTPGVYFDAAPHYPGTVPLTQVWAATLLGRWDDALVNVPWWFSGIAFGFALYGFLAQQRMAALAALIGTWLVLSLPMFEVHIALAGYADLAMATFFTLAALTTLRWARTREWADAIVALLLLAACVLIKNPGKVWVVTLIPGVAAALLPRLGLRFAGACFGLAAIVVAVLARSGVTILGYHLHLDFEMPWRGLYEAYFAFANWHLLWYGAIAVALLARRQLLSRGLAPLTITIAAGVSFLMFGFVFTNASTWVEDQSTVNRASLHLAPLLAIWMLLTFRAWAAKQPAKPDDAVGPAPDRPQ